MRLPTRGPAASECLLPSRPAKALKWTSVTAPAHFVHENGKSRAVCLRCAERSCMSFSSDENVGARVAGLLSVCPANALSFDETTGRPEPSVRCIGCGICVLRCPFGALFIDAETNRVRSLPPEGAGDFTYGGAADVRKLGKELVREAPSSNKRLVADSKILTRNVGASTQDTFYPLVGSLLTTLGLPTRVTRRGDTGLRFDAVILVDDAAVPIEIKSPTEVDAASIKAVQQALENRIVLLSRRLYSTNSTSTSLVVSYAPAAARSDVAFLVDDIWEAFSVAIGLIDVRALFELALGASLAGWGIQREDLLELRGEW